MGKFITVKAEDGHQLAAYEAIPTARPKGGLVVFQEIFGVNNHIRNLCERLAADSYHAVAPALFDRAERNVELGYTAETMERGRTLRGQLQWEEAILDAKAAVVQVKNSGKTAVVGYCWGGSMAWLSACRIAGLACAVGYYGGQIAQFNAENPRCPTMLHFGAKDPFIPLSDVEKIKAAHRDVTVHVYADADHGFECDERASFHAPSQKLARERTLAFFAQHLK
ncbi:MAG: dienelactone hydrolase family protein [Alphaproteobacteria bacterium]|nr:dienelactone hydrolase family protein [Alphaproteobacteria bacterium]